MVTINGAILKRCTKNAMNEPHAAPVANAATAPSPKANPGESVCASWLWQTSVNTMPEILPIITQAKLKPPQTNTRKYAVAKHPFSAIWSIIFLKFASVGNCEGLICGEADDFGAAGRVLPVMNIGKIADAIVELVQNPGLREQMGEIGYRRVCSRYRIQDMRKTYEEIYRKMEGEASWQE